MHQDARAVLVEDPKLAELVNDHGDLELDPADDVFRRLVVSIVRQQVSMDSAAAISDRLFDAVDVTPGGILSAEPDTLQAAGLSSAKTEYVRAAACYFQDRDSAYFEDRSDDEVMSELTDIRGIGPWTGKMFLLFGLGREDVFPVEDLGIRKGMQALYDGDLTRTEMEEIAADWRPYRSYGSLYVWRGYED